MPQLGDVVAPELETHRLCHPETVDVEYPAAYAELSDVLYHWYALEPNGFKMPGQLLQPARVSLAQLEPSGCERPWQLGALEERAGGSDEHAQITASDSLQRFHSFPGDFGVSFRFTKTFSRRVKGDVVGLQQSAEISQPSFSARDIVIHDYEKTG